MIDVAAEILAALRSPEVAKAIAEVVRPVVAEEVERLLDRRRDEPLKPLAEILGLTPNAARMREARDPRLMALAVPVGRRRFYRAAEVELYLRAEAPRRRDLVLHEGG